MSRKAIDPMDKIFELFAQLGPAEQIAVRKVLAIAFEPAKPKSERQSKKSSQSTGASDAGKTGA